MNKAARGFFITLEGGEGAGKSTLSKGLTARAEALGNDIVQTREPGGTPLAESIRHLVLTPRNGDAWTPMAEALLMNAARADHIERKIAPALARGSWVICDRFADSTRAYQGINGGVALDVLKTFERAVLDDVIPDVTFILDAAPEDLLARRAGRDEAVDAFEARDLSFHRQVRQAFLEIAEEAPERCVLLDALAPPDQLADQAMRAVTDLAMRQAGLQ